jgi:large subunit ribosomal protein L23
MQTRPRPVKYRRKNRKRFAHKPGTIKHKNFLDARAETTSVELRPHQVLLQPLVTEKGTHLSTRHNAYTFQVNLLSTKVQIKQAVEEMFNVRVLDVRTQIRDGKKRRYRMKMGQMSAWKKAIVKLHEEDKIDFF